MSGLLGLLLINWIFLWRISTGVQSNITAKSGENVTLPCWTPNRQSTDVMEWSRSDQKEQYVLMYLDGHIDLAEQDPSFKDRVDLQDRQMNDGDVSLILMEVTIKDTGTYECRVLQRGPSRKRRANLETNPISKVYLVVAPPGQTGGHREDGTVFIFVITLLIAGCLVAIFWISIKCRKDCDSDRPRDFQNSANAEVLEILMMKPMENLNEEPQPVYSHNSDSLRDNQDFFSQ